VSDQTGRTLLLEWGCQLCVHARPASRDREVAVVGSLLVQLFNCFNIFAVDLTVSWCEVGP
jgi:hypothetical protein